MFYEDYRRWQMEHGQDYRFEPAEGTEDEDLWTIEEDDDE